MKKNCIAFPSGTEWRDNTEQTKYEIVIPLQKETLRRRLKETTYPLCIEKMCIRDSYGSHYRRAYLYLSAGRYVYLRRFLHSGLEETDRRSS